MRKTITIKELNELLQEWKLESAKCFFSINKSFDIEEKMKLSVKSNVINKCCLDLYELMSAKI